jgi:tight adherence protein B
VLLSALAQARRRSSLSLAGLGPRSRASRDRRAPSTPLITTGVAGVAGLAVATLAGPIVGIAVATCAVAAPWVVRRRRVARRAALIEGQLIELVVAIASTIRSGRSLSQAVQTAARDVGEPVGTLLVEAADRISLGVPFDAAIDDWAEAVGGADARLVAGVLRLHRQTGGALARSLDEVVRTLRGRRDAARELRSLTAQSRMSAAILGLLPFGFFLFLSVVARRDVEAAYRTPVGASAIGVGLALQGLAFVWIRRLLRVDDS